MATIAGGSALPLRIPSPALEPVRRRRMESIRGEVKKAFHRLALQYHPDVVRRCDGGGDDDDVDFQRNNVAYQTVMCNVREAEARLEYWRARYGLADEDLDRYHRYLNDEDEDDLFADL
ncbi:hypothetical protein ACQ4PT_066371 [Festuca glaucescens]